MPQSRNADTEEILGVIECVTFHNEENGFYVLRIKTKGHREKTTVYASFSFHVPMTKSSSLFCLDCTHFAYDSSVVLIDLCPRSLLTSSSGTPFLSRSTANVSRRQWGVKIS